VFITKYFSGDQIKEKEFGGSYSTMVRGAVYT